MNQNAPFPHPAPQKRKTTETFSPLGVEKEETAGLCPEVLLKRERYFIFSLQLVLKLHRARHKTDAST